MEFVYYGLIAVLAAAAGYCAGRWHGAASYATLKKQHETDTQKFMEMLEERNESYVKYKANNADQSQQIRGLQLEIDKLEQREVQSQEREQGLKQQLAEFEPRMEKFRSLTEQWNEERLGLREERATLKAELDSLNRQLVQLQAGGKSLQERFDLVSKERTSLQTQLVSKEREARDYQRQAQKLEDSQETSELSLAQMRVAREELANRLAYAEGQLKALNGATVTDLHS